MAALVKDAAAEAAALTKMFISSPPPAQMAQLNALLALPFVPGTVLFPNPGGPTNISFGIPVRMDTILPLIPKRPPAVGLFGTPRAVAYLDLRNICEHVDSTQVPPRSLPGTVPVCAIMPQNFYPGHPWPAPPARTLAMVCLFSKHLSSFVPVMGYEA
jgi:hypothetical protein